MTPTTRASTAAQRDGADRRNREAAIDRVLTAIDARVERQHRITMSAGEATTIPAAGVTLVYIIEGDVSIDMFPRQIPHFETHTGSEPSTDSRFRAGDAVMFTGRESHSLTVPQHAFVLISALDFTDAASHVLQVLPDMISVRDLAGSEPAVAALASQLGPEVGTGVDPCSDQPGSSVVCRMMANTVLVSVIRTWVLHGCAPAGWPSRTNDPYLDRVVEAIHADPARGWTIEDLARAGAMSRSVFAARFRSATGVSPANYVTEVRIRSAQDLLARGLGVSEVSRAIGYGSDEGFSRAFRRHVGQTPSVWRSSALRTAAA